MYWHQLSVSPFPETSSPTLLWGNCSRISTWSIKSLLAACIYTLSSRCIVASTVCLIPLAIASKGSGMSPNVLQPTGCQDSCYTQQLCSRQMTQTWTQIELNRSKFTPKPMAFKVSMPCLPWRIGLKASMEGHWAQYQRLALIVVPLLHCTVDCTNGEPSSGTGTMQRAGWQVLFNLLLPSAIDKPKAHVPLEQNVHLGWQNSIHT